MASNSNCVGHDFYCMKCGKKGIPLMRKKGHQYGKFHRKKLYCPFCKEEVNHIEVKTCEDKLKFLDDFENGVFKDEVEESLSFIRNSGLR